MISKIDVFFKYILFLSIFLFTFIILMGLQGALVLVPAFFGK